MFLFTLLVFSVVAVQSVPQDVRTAESGDGINPDAGKCGLDEFGRHTLIPAEHHAAQAEVPDSSTSAIAVASRIKRSPTGESSIPQEGLSLGCFDRWKFRNNPEYLHNTEFSAQKCIAACKVNKNEVALVRGMQCICMDFDSVKNIDTRLKDEYCDIHCSDASSRTAPADGPSVCGGNLAMSGYCTGSGHCELVTAPQNDLEDYDLEELENLRKNIVTIKASGQCLKCEEDHCVSGATLMPKKDYFPLNNAAACILSCRRPLIENGENMDYKIAHLYWVQFPSARLPVCLCNDEQPPDGFTLVSPEECDESCPTTGEEEFCGKYKEHYTSYCTSEDESCRPMSAPSPPQTTDGSRSPSTSTTMSTEEATSTLSSSASSSSGLPSTTESITSEPSTSTQFTTSTATSTIPSDSTTTIRTSTQSPEVSSQPPPDVCILSAPMTSLENCSATFKNILWEACPGQLVSKSCVVLKDGTKGWATWFCPESGRTFATPQPNTSGCQAEWYDDLRDKYQEALDQNNQTLPEQESVSLLDEMKKKCQPSSSNDEASYYGHEIPKIANFMAEIVKTTQAKSEMAMRDILKTAMQMPGLLLGNREPWQDLDTLTRAKAGNELFAAVEQSLFKLWSVVNVNNYIAMFTSDNLDPDYMLLGYGTGSKAAGAELIFPSEAGSYISLDAGWESLVASPDYVGYAIDSELYRDIFPPQLNGFNNEEGNAEVTKVLNGKLLSITIGGGQQQRVASKGQDLEGKKVRVTIQHDVEAWGETPQIFYRQLHPNETRKAVQGSAACVYWSVIDNIWSTKGCRTISVTGTHTICECDHLTSFAVIMDLHDYVGKDFVLKLFTFILCPISIVCFVMSIIIFSTVDSIQSQRTTITKHLCFCLALGTVLQLFFVDRDYFDIRKHMCTVIGVVTHYVYLCAFMWMFVEGICLYKMVVQVFNSTERRASVYRIFAYGVPILIVGVTGVVGFLLDDHPYGGEMYCWLSGNYIWSFIVPVALVVTCNFTILLVALKMAFQMRTSTAVLQVRQNNYKRWIRGSFSLTIVLGLTWLPGFFMLINSPSVGKVAGYCFVILNASQGIQVFIFHCYFNESVRRVARRKFSWPGTKSSSGGHRLDQFPTRHNGNEGPRSDTNAAYISDASRNYNNFAYENNGFDLQPEQRRIGHPSPISRNALVDKCLRKESNSSGFVSDNSFDPDLLMPEQTRLSRSNSGASDFSQSE